MDNHQKAKCQQVSVNEIDSPEPPVFCTPGAKQLRNHRQVQSSANPDTISENNTPEPPVFMTPGLPQLTGKPVNSSGVVDNIDSPEPPVFCTPGMKQLRNHRQLESSAKPDTISENNTPEPPVFMTPGLPQITGKPVNSSGVVDNDTPEPPVLCTPWTKQIRKLPAVNRTADTVESSSSHIGYDIGPDTPEPPELTSDFGAMLCLHQHKVSMVNTLDTKGNIPVGEKENGADGSPDSNFLRGKPIFIQSATPEAPELTFSYKV